MQGLSNFQAAIGVRVQLRLGEMIPPKVVLVAVDFSDPSATTMAFAARLARQAHATLHVVYAEDPLLADAARRAGIDLAGDTGEELGRFIASTLGTLQAPAELLVETGPAVDVVLASAERLHADVIVLGSHGMSGAERLMFGSTTEGVLRHSPVSVMVTPPAWRPPHPGSADLSGTGPVVVGLDLGESSGGTLTTACRLASLLGTSVEAVHVVADPPVLARWRPHAEIAVRDRVTQGRENLDRLIQAAAGDVATRGTVETGAVPERLAATAAATPGRSPVLVLGRRAHEAKAGPPGAIAYRALLLARVPVLMHVGGR